MYKYILYENVYTQILMQNIINIGERYFFSIIATKQYDLKKIVIIYFRLSPSL